MFTIFGIEFIIYAYFAYTANNFESWFLYNFCLWVSGYYCWKYINEKTKSYKLAYVFLSNILLSFILICKIFDIWYSNL